MGDRGTKRKCSTCGSSYYDLNRTPVRCPKCGAPYEAAAPIRPPRGRLPATPPPRVPHLEEEVAESGAEAESEIEETEDLPKDEEAFVPPEDEDDRD